ncbi:MAG: L7Ae/L30e/S12e/Gadd45 family ribosomal protein [Bacillota bacterium]
MLGLANKAGKLVSGDETVRNSIRQGKVKLLIISEDASENTCKRFVNTSVFYKVEYIQWGKKELLGYYIGKSERSVVGILDDSFSRNILELIGHALKQKEDNEQNAGGELFEQN